MNTVELPTINRNFRSFVMRIRYSLMMALAVANVCPSRALAQGGTCTLKQRNNRKRRPKN
jgi:hypothetical protein